MVVSYPKLTFNNMTTAEQIYRESVWGSKMVCCPIEHIKPTTFAIGEKIVNTMYLEDRNVLYFEDIYNGKITFTYYLNQNGVVTSC